MTLLPLEACRLRAPHSEEPVTRCEQDRPLQCNCHHWRLVGKFSQWVAGNRMPENDSSVVSSGHESCRKRPTQRHSSHKVIMPHEHASDGGCGLVPQPYRSIIPSTRKVTGYSEASYHGCVTFVRVHPIARETPLAHGPVVCTSVQELLRTLRRKGE